MIMIPDKNKYIGPNVVAGKDEEVDMYCKYILGKDVFDTSDIIGEY